MPEQEQPERSRETAAADEASKQRFAALVEKLSAGGEVVEDDPVHSENSVEKFYDINDTTGILVSHELTNTAFFVANATVQEKIEGGLNHRFYSLYRDGRFEVELQFTPDRSGQEIAEARQQFQQLRPEITDQWAIEHIKEYAAQSEQERALGLRAVTQAEADELFTLMEGLQHGE